MFKRREGYGIFSVNDNEASRPVLNEEKILYFNIL